MEKNGTFFYKERKRTERTEHSFIKNGKERKERNVLYKEQKRTERSFERTDAQPWNLVSILVSIHLLRILASPHLSSTEFRKSKPFHYVRNVKYEFTL